MTVIARAKQNPLATAAITIVAIAAGFVGIWEGVGLADKLHTTEAELLLYDLKAHTCASGQFDALELQIKNSDIVSKCRWLKSEIRALKDAIYVRKRDGADADYINDLEGDLEDLEADYSVLACARALA